MLLKSGALWSSLLLVSIVASEAALVCIGKLFPCVNGKYVSPCWQCDGEDDCGDNSDEQNCPERLSLLFKHHRNLVMRDIESSEEEIIATNIENPYGIDYDFRKNMVLWTDIENGSINSVFLQNGNSERIFRNPSTVQSVLKDEIINSEGLAVDWIHDNLYWTDKVKRSISVATLDGKSSKVLFDKNINNPRAIAVNPLEGWLFWTEWGKRAKIERAGMDGSHRSVIVSENIAWPNGLTIDFTLRKIFWADADLNTISSSDYDGSHVKVILSSASDIQYPLSLDVFEDWLYWSDFKSHTISRVEKNSGRNVETVVSELFVSTGVKIYHRSKQPKGVNHCGDTNGNCSHLCLPAPQINEDLAKFTCTCPSGMVLTDNKRKCDFVERVSLIFKNGGNLVMRDIESSEEEIIATNIENPFDIDYDFGKNLVLWSDTENGCINSVFLQNEKTDTNFRNPSTVQSVLKDEIIKSEGLAVDWIHDNLYWTNKVKRSISVATLDGKWIKLLFDKNINKPRAIAVNPLEGWFFWTDWGTPAKIERAGLDGTQRSTVVSENIVWPNGLAIDFTTRKIFWADAYLDTLSSSDYDGSHSKVILSSARDIGHPIFLDVCEGWLYWNNFQNISRVDKVSGTDVQTVVRDIWSDVRVYHSSMQPKGENYCGQSNGNCSHFCLPSPQITPESAKFACVCPDGMELMKNKRNCDIC